MVFMLYFLAKFISNLLTVIFHKDCLDSLHADGTNNEGSEESTVGHSYVKKKLEHGLSRIWQVSNTLIFIFDVPI